MKIKTQVSKALSSAIFALAILFGSSVFAQVKIGANPTVISPNSNLEVEATNGKKVIVHKDNGTVMIENTPSGAPTDSIMTVDANGNVRRRNLSAVQNTTQVNPYIKTRGTIVAWSQQATSVSYISNQAVQQQKDITYNPATGEMTIVKPGMYFINSMSTSPENQFPNFARHCSFITVNNVNQMQVCSSSSNGATVAVSNSNMLSLSAGDKIKVGIGTASTAGDYYTWEFVVSMYKVSDK